MSKTKKTYIYPDTNDQVTTSFIQEKESFKGQWASSEKEVLNTIKQYLKKKPRSWLLDAGCGTGRLLPEFQGYFDHVLAVDPDASQIEKAKILVKNVGFSEKVTFKATPIEMLEWDKESLDVVLCSHVLQHTHTDSVGAILQKFNEISKANALLFILTTHSQKKDYYAKDFLSGQRACEEIIGRDEFNSLAVNRKGVLPVHFFSLDTLEAELQQAGFEVLDSKLFHWLESTKPHVSSARDMLLVCKKMNLTHR